MRRIVGAAALTIGLFLPACGGGDDDPTVAGTGGDASKEDASKEMDHHGGSAAMCSPSGTTVSIVASGTAFDKECLAAPAGQAFQITMENKDGIGHNIAVLEGHESAEVLFRADIFSGPKTSTFDVGALKAGTYAFHCEIHPGQMRGTFVVA